MTRLECAKKFVAEVNERRIKFKNKEIEDITQF